MTEQTPRQRFLSVVGFWLLLVGLVLLLWWLRVFWLVAALFMLFLEQVNLGLIWLGSPTEGGFSAYFSVYWPYWMAGWLIFSVMVVVVYRTWYRHKRPLLVVGQGVEGRVLWVKGVRRGLIYAVWDVSNYLRGAGSPFGRGSQTAVSRPPTATSPGTLPDPLTIPVGRTTRRRVVYFSRPWRLKMERLVIQNHHRIDNGFYEFVVPEGYLVNIPDRERPGRSLLVLVDDLDRFREYDPDAPEEFLDAHLKKARGLVQNSVAANPETNKLDFTEGSYPVMGGRDA